MIAKLCAAVALTLPLAVAADSGAARAAQPAVAGVERIRDQARRIKADAEAMMLALRVKNLDEKAVREKAEALSGAIAALRAAVEAYDRNEPAMTGAQRENQEFVKTQVRLLELFLTYKNEFLQGGNLKSNRRWLLTHAGNIVERVALLQQAVAGL